MSKDSKENTIGIEDGFKVISLSDPYFIKNGITLLYSKGDLEKNSYLRKIVLVNPSSGEWKPVVEGKEITCYKPLTSERLVFSHIKKQDNKVKTIIGVSDLLKSWDIIEIPNPTNNLEVLSEKLIVTLVLEGEIKRDEPWEIEEWPFWFNGPGWIFHYKQRLYAYDLDSGEKEEISIPKGYKVLDYRVNRATGHVALLLSPNPFEAFNQQIWIVKYGEGEPTLIKDKVWVETLSWNEKGKLFVSRLSGERGLASRSIFEIYDTTTGEWKDITPPDWNLNIGNGVLADSRTAPSCKPPVEYIGENIHFLVTIKGRVDLYSLNISTGELQKTLTEKGTIDYFTVNENEIAIVLNRFNAPHDLYLFSNGKIKRITRFNEWIEKKGLQQPMRFQFEASDGKTVEGWILKSYQPGERPVILEIHGGPMAAYGDAFIHEFHYLASKGFHIVFMNPRGSLGYGDEFKDIRGKYGERDYLDIIEGFLKALEMLKGETEEGAYGVTGGSYGGFMTNWVVSNTDLFKAAVSQRGISNWLSFYGTSDIGPVFTEDQLGTDPWSGRDKLFLKSPISYAPRVNTPLLILHSTEDYRCWLDQAVQWYTALKRHNKKVKMVLFPGENHDLSRTGKPRNRVKRLKYIEEWFRKHLKEARREELGIEY